MKSFVSKRSKPWPLTHFRSKLCWAARVLLVLTLSKAAMASSEQQPSFDGSVKMCSNLVVSSAPNDVAKTDLSEQERVDLSAELQSYLQVFNPLDRGQSGALEVLSLFFQNKYESRFENEFNEFMMRPTDVVRVANEHQRISELLSLAKNYSQTVQELNDTIVAPKKNWFQRDNRTKIPDLEAKVDKLAGNLKKLKSQMEESRNSYLDYVEQASTQLKKLDDHSLLLENLVVAIGERISSLTPVPSDTSESSVLIANSVLPKQNLRILRWENLLDVISQKMSKLVKSREDLGVRMKSSSLGWQVTSSALDTINELQLQQRFGALKDADKNSNKRVFDKDGRLIDEIDSEANSEMNDANSKAVARAREKRTSIFDLMRPLKMGETVLVADEMETNFEFNFLDGAYKRELGLEFTVVDPLVFTPLAGVLTSPTRLISFAFRNRRSFTLEFIKVRVFQEIMSPQTQKVPRAYLALTDSTINWMGLKVGDRFTGPNADQWVIAGFTYYGAVLCKHPTYRYFKVLSVRQIKRYLKNLGAIEKN